MLHLGVITILPDIFTSLQYGVLGRALEQNIAKVTCWNPRDWALNDHRQIDDRPYGGGPGMVMMYEPLHSAILHAKKNMPEGCKTIYLSPQGRTVHQTMLKTVAAERTPLLFVAGRYEGIDERVLHHDIDEEWSLGDFVLSGGEFAALVLMDAIVRLLPGGLGHPGSALADSFMDGLLDYPHYTRPATVDNMQVPNVLLSGSHRIIARWQRKQSLGKTWLKRPDLLALKTLSDEDQRLLIEFKIEHDEE